MGGFTMNTDIDINIYDVILNLDEFNDKEMEQLKYAINEKDSDNNFFKIETLDEHYKVKILKEFFNKYSLEELDKIKKQLN